MKTEIELRQQAIALYLQGWKKSEIARKVQHSRRWVPRWISRYRRDAAKVSLQDHSRAPKHISWTYPERIKRMVIQIRVERECGKRAKYQYALVSAQAIYYELRELYVSPLPSPRTIHQWLKQADRIPERKSRKPPNPTYPVLPCKAVNDVQELDFKGPFYLKDHSHKYYLVALRDKLSKKTALRALANKSMDAILDFLMNAWQRMGCPKRLKMDNCLDFRGSNLYPRSPSKLVRVCLDLGVQPVFIPLREPWRNGVVENLNGLLNRFLLRLQTFDTEKQLHQAVQRLETTINTTHRLPALQGKTPQEFAAHAKLRYPPALYDWRKRDLQLVKGKVTFIRLVRKSGRITLTANDKFLIGKKYKWQYVLAVVDVAKRKLNVIWQGKHLKSFDYR
ncbi:MAG TPA: helix-turn-helix domain-containing protein [Anaerolineales bacterium]|nr:helix-turn-helix domain-containing protein [Anaerolineales bacterium]